MSITRQHRELKRWTTRTPPTYIHYKTTQRTKTVNNKNATKICPLQDNTENLKGEQQERHQHMSITRQHRELNRWTTRTPSTLLSNLLYLLTLLIDQNASAIQIFGLFLTIKSSGIFLAQSLILPGTLAFYRIVNISNDQQMSLISTLP